MKNNLIRAYQKYAALNISFEVFEHTVQLFLKFSKDKTDTEKRFSIEYLGNRREFEFNVNVSTSTIAAVLRRYLEGIINIKELENWASVLVMDDDHFIIAENEPSPRRDSAIDALHQVANWPHSLSRLDIESYISRITS